MCMFLFSESKVQRRRELSRKRSKKYRYKIRNDPAKLELIRQRGREKQKIRRQEGKVKRRKYLSEERKKVLREKDRLRKYKKRINK